MSAEDLLRRHGPAKTNVVDVARALGISHSAVYRHFPSKAALRDTVVERWLADVSRPLAAVAAGPEPPLERLAAWLDLLVTTKQQRARNDPELFHAYLNLAAEARAVVLRHVDELVAQLTRIVADGITASEIESRDAAATARAVFDATARFHNPANSADWDRDDIGEAYRNVRALVLHGLRAPAPSG